MTDGQRRDRTRRIRVWAVQHGHEVPWNRRIPNWIVELYELDQARHTARRVIAQDEEAG